MQRIELHNVSKVFNVGYHRNATTLARLVSAVSGKEDKRRQQVLENISFHVNAGEIIGIIGPNGAGKSTLLSIIAGIYLKNSGIVRVDGHVVSVLGLNNGLKDRLSMRDNIFLCCSLFGLDKKTIKEKLASIVAFSELADYLDTKLYQFSSGMIARLVLAIAIHCRPEILLLDEVTNHLDEDFNILAWQTLVNLSHKGSSILIASHDKSIIQKCHRVIWLEKGEIRTIGHPQEILQQYSIDQLCLV